MNYLQMVNKAATLSGVEIDELTSSNFASTTDNLSKRFKTFVADAWRDLQIERDEWEFKSATGSTTIYPRVLIENGDRSTAPPANSEFEGDTTTANFTVLSSTLLDGTWLGGNAVAWLDLDDLTISSLLFGEVYDEVDPDPLNVNVFTIKGFGTFDVLGDLSDGWEVNKSSFSIQSPTTPNSKRLKWISWAEYQQVDNANNGIFGEPTAITEAPGGTFQLYPHPNQSYRLAFEYTKAPHELSSYDDTPEGLPLNYHDAIVYRAMMYYADFDSKPHVFARAERRYNLLKNRLEKNLMPTFTWGVNVYDSIRF